MKPQFIDPLAFVELCWPDVRLYDKQRDILYSVRDNNQTVVPAGNMLGKDFVSALVVLWFFLSRDPCRIVTTSAKEEHLDVLWGEMKQFIQTSKVELEGTNLTLKHMEMKRIINGKECGISYVKGMVANQNSAASLGGHHATGQQSRFNELYGGNGTTGFSDYLKVPRSLFLADECSSVPHFYWKQIQGWARRILLIGNCWPCDNFFRYSVEGFPDGKDTGGDKPHPTNKKVFYRKVIRITGDDSPNVKYAKAQKEIGVEPNGEVILPGVLPWDEYCLRRETQSPDVQCVSLDATWYIGTQNRLFPPEWLDRAAEIAEAMEKRGRQRRAESIGIDPGEGGDKSTQAAVDMLGLIEMESRLTPNTMDVPREAITFMDRHKVNAKDVCFDRGGGGKQHADHLRELGRPVRTVAFGEAASDEATRWRRMRTMKERKEDVEERYTYVNRRAEMFGMLSMMIDPSWNPQGFGIPGRYYELRRQLSVFPRMYDGEGRLKLPPKNRTNQTSKEATLTDLLGCSPDEADALAIAVFCMLVKSSRPVAGLV